MGRASAERGQVCWSWKIPCFSSFWTFIQTIFQIEFKKKIHIYTYIICFQCNFLILIICNLFIIHPVDSVNEWWSSSEERWEDIFFYRQHAEYLSIFFPLEENINWVSLWRDVNQPPAEQRWPYWGRFQSSGRSRWMHLLPPHSHSSFHQKKTLLFVWLLLFFLFRHVSPIFLERAPADPFLWLVPERLHLHIQTDHMTVLQLGVIVVPFTSLTV